MTPAVSSAFRRCLIELDVVLLRRIWPRVMPHLPPIAGEALTVIHMARTESESMPVAARLYSHWWLAERGIPSKLPEALKPPHEKEGAPRIAEVVGISVNSQEPEVQRAIHGVMRDAVLEAQADSVRDAATVRRMMHEARMRERRALGLRSLQD